MQTNIQLKKGEFMCKLYKNLKSEFGSINNDFFDHIESTMEAYNEINGTFNLLLKLKKTTDCSSRQKCQFEQDSIFDIYNFECLKGKRMAIDKKNYETSIVSCISQGQELINNTIKMIDSFNTKTITVQFGEIKEFLCDDDNLMVVWLKNQSSKNKNKIISNFLMYSIDNEVYLEFDNTIFWMNSDLSYLS